MPTYDFKCKECEHKSIEFVRYDDRDTIRIKCTECQADMTRVMSMPTVLKASYLDGQKREGFEEMRIDNKLKMAAIKATGEGKFDDVKEIDKEYAERKEKS